MRAPLLVFVFDSKFGPSAWTPRFAVSVSSFVSLAHGPRWLFLLSRHHKAISAAVNQKPFCK